MYCSKCGTKLHHDSNFCTNCGTSVALATDSSINETTSIKKDFRNLDVLKTLQMKSTSLSKEEFPSEDEKLNKWQEGIFIGKEGGKFYVDLPTEYNYNYDIRLRDTNAFIIKNPNYAFTVNGVEISAPISSRENLADFKNSIDTELQKAIGEYKQMGISLPGSARELHIIETEKSWWLRATFVYSTDMARFRKHSGYNLLGKALLKISGTENAMKKAGYKNNVAYREHKILDFFYPKIKNTPSFLLRYAFDEISGGDTRAAMIAINGISDSLGYYTEAEAEYASPVI